MSWRIELGDVFDVLPTLPSESVQCVVTSPPYWGLRDYGVAGQLGLQQTPDEYVADLATVFDEVRRVLRSDGTCWVNLGDSYQNAKGQAGGFDPKQPARRHGLRPQDVSIPGLKAKDLVGVPWMFAFEARRRGWWLRADIIWAKGNPTPEPVMDRPTKAHEYVFLLTKSARYYYDADAIREPLSESTMRDFAVPYGGNGTKDYDAMGAQNPSAIKRRIKERQRAEGPRGANRRSVWAITPNQFKGSHAATFPEGLPELCIKAGTRPGDIVLDPFAGAGTTGLVAERLGRDFIGIELNPAYREIARERIRSAAPLLTEEWLVQAAGDGPRTGGRTS